MRSRAVAISFVLLLAQASLAQHSDHSKSEVSFEDFKGLVERVEAHRAHLLVDLATFLDMIKRPGVVILDSRSDFRFERIRLEGARHLAFTDVTQENLARVIPSLETSILICCNNDFDGNPTDFATKVALPRPASGAPASKFAAPSKPLMKALNVPIYISLYGYGNRNV